MLIHDALVLLTTHDDRRRPFAIGHLSDSAKWPKNILWVSACPSEKIKDSECDYSILQNGLNSF